MIQFEFKEKEYTMPDQAIELSLWQMIQFAKLEGRTKLMPIGEEMLAIQYLEILTGSDGDFDDIGLTQLINLHPYIKAVLDGIAELKIPDVNKQMTWTIDGKLYAHRFEEDIPIGEVIDIKEFKTKATNEYEYLFDVCSILIKPAVKAISEGGIEYLKLVGDHIDFTNNKEKIAKAVKYVELCAAANFFLTGSQKLMVTSKDSLKIKKVA